MNAVNSVADAEIYLRTRRFGGGRIGDAACAAAEKDDADAVADTPPGAAAIS